MSTLSSGNPFRLAVLMAVLAVCRAGVAQGSDPSFQAARAESERKGRELKSKAEEHRKEIEAKRQAARKRLGLPDPPVAKAKTPADLEELRKKLALPDPKSFGRSSTPGMTKNPVEYTAKRGDEFAFLVEITATDGGTLKQWRGTPYFAGVYSDVGRSIPEMFCIGTLACQVRGSPDRPWTSASIDDVEFPQRWMVGSTGILGAETTSLFDQHTLPLQMSAILPLEEMIFPELPMFSDNPRNETKNSSTFYLRGGEKNFFGDVPTKTLEGESRRVCRIEQETSSMPRIINERSFQSPSSGIGLSFKQVGVINAREGMIQSVDIEYLLDLEGRVPATVKVRRLSGDDLAKARTEALKRMPKTQWPAYFRRIPADDRGLGPHIPRSVSDIPIGQKACISIDINERCAHGARDYLGQTIAGAPPKKVRVRLDGSNEELDVSPSDVRVMK